MGRVQWILDISIPEYNNVTYTLMALFLIDFSEISDYTICMLFSVANRRAFVTITVCT